MQRAKGLRFALRASWRLWRGMRTCGEVAELARIADFLGFDALCRELCKSSSESYANRPVELDGLGKGACVAKGVGDVCSQVLR